MCLIAEVQLPQGRRRIPLHVQLGFAARFGGMVLGNFTDNISTLWCCLVSSRIVWSSQAAVVMNRSDSLDSSDALSSSDPPPQPKPDGEDSAAEAGREADPWRLDPSRFPVTLELELPALVVRQLRQLAERSGRNLDEIVITLIDGQLRGLSEADADDPPSS